MKEKIKNYFLYGDISREDYKSIQKLISDDNKKNLKIYSLISFIGFLGCIIFSFTEPRAALNRTMYISVAAVSLLVLILVDMLKRTKIIYLQYLFTVALYAFGISLGTITTPDEPTISYVILLFVVPMLFVDVPVRTIICSVASIITYFIAALNTQTAEMFRYNAFDVIAYGIMSLAVSSYLMKVKIERHFYVYHNRQLIEYDQMTEIYNRRSYDNHIREIKEYEKNKKKKIKHLKVCSLDVNGLKHENDTYGHSAGDKMIKASADCLKAVLSEYGSCYRTGGDEFVAILYKETPTVEELTGKLYSKAEEWHSENGSELSVSIGFADKCDSADIEEMIRISDARMYEAKRQYYLKKGIPHR